MNRKYIIFDLDDTLLNNAKEVTDFTLSILKKVQHLGHYLIINTARSKQYAQEYINLIKPDFSILNGGSLIIDNNEENVYLNAINVDNTNAICKELLKISSTISVQTLDAFYAYDDYKGQNAVKFDFLNDNLNKEALKILACSEDENGIKEIAKKYNLEYINYFNGPWRRLNAFGSSKWNGVLTLLKINNGSIDNILTFGDDLGDLEMIENAKVGVLMKNAKDELKNDTIIVSQYSNEEDGVAKFLIEYFNL